MEKTVDRHASSSSGASSVPSVEEMPPSLEKVSLQIIEVARVLTTISEQLHALHGPVHQL